jgi:KDO2-lipid IV(A) lauroyltransferase
MARHETPDLKDRLEYGALVALLAAMRAPSARRGRGWGRALGRFAARSVPLRREVALENLRAAFPELDPGARAAVYAAMLENLGEVLGGFARFGKGRPEPITDTIRVANPEAFAEAHRAGRGAVLLTAHYGNWEAFGAAIAACGYPVTVLGGRQRNPLVESLFARYRGRMGLGTLTVGKSLKPLVKTLREGSFVASLADQDGGPGGFFLDFLGRKASVQPGLFRLLARSGVPMVTGFAVRDGEGWRGELQSPVWPARARDEASVEGEARRLAALYTLRVEQYVRARPDHWFWVHRRWRTRPPEELD